MIKVRGNRIKNIRGAALTEVLAVTVAVAVGVGIIIVRLHPQEEVTSVLLPGEAQGVIVGRGQGVPPKIEADAVIAYTKKTACRSNVRIINTAVEMWNVEKERWPKDDLSDIARDRRYFPNSIPRCPVNDTPYRLNPVLHRIAGHAHDDIANPFEEKTKPKKKKVKALKKSE